MSTLETSAPVAFIAAIAITSAMIATAIGSFASRIVMSTLEASGDLEALEIGRASCRERV